MSSSSPDTTTLTYQSCSSCPAKYDALPVEVFDENNPGPSFEEVFPEYAYEDPACYDDDADLEIFEEADPCETFVKEFENCTCCQGFVYNCEGMECSLREECCCVGDKKLEPIYVQVYSE